VQGRSAVRILAAFAAIAALSVAAAPAQAQTKKPIAGGKLKTATANARQVANLQIASATAECPGKTKAVAGGFATTPPLVQNGPGGHYLNVYESQMIGNDQWRVSAVQYRGAFDNLTAYVYCQKRKKALSQVSNTTLLPGSNNATGFTDTQCNKGKVLSGGFATEPPTLAGGTVVNESRRVSKREWSASATRVDGVQVRTLTTYAYCAKVSKIKQRSRTVPVLGPRGSSHKATPKKCQKKSKPRAGGFTVPPLTTGLSNAAVVHESRLVGNRWIASASATGNGTNSSVTSYQYCRT